MSYKVFEFPRNYLLAEIEKSYLFFDKKTNTKCWLSKKLVKSVDEDQNTFTLILPDTFNLKFFRSKKEEGEYVITDTFEIDSELFTKTFKQFSKENKPFSLKTKKKNTQTADENPFLQD
jgi:C4-type Zn-finger protein